MNKWTGHYHGHYHAAISNGETVDYINEPDPDKFVAALKRAKDEGLQVGDIHRVCSWGCGQPHELDRETRGRINTLHLQRKEIEE